MYLNKTQVLPKWACALCRLDFLPCVQKIHLCSFVLPRQTENSEESPFRGLIAWWKDLDPAPWWHCIRLRGTRRPNPFARRGVRAGPDCGRTHDVLIPLLMLICDNQYIFPTALICDNQYHLFAITLHFLSSKHTKDATYLSDISNW